MALTRFKRHHRANCDKFQAGKKKPPTRKQAKDFARVDHCINGFVALIKRLMPEFDVCALDRVSRKLTNGVLLTHEEVEACFAAINRCEDRLIEFTRDQLIDAARTEQVNIELERMGLKDAARARTITRQRK